MTDRQKADRGERAASAVRSRRREGLRATLGALEHLRSVLERGDPDLYEAFAYTLTPLTLSIMSHLSELEGSTPILLWDVMLWWDLDPPDLHEPEYETMERLRYEASARTEEWRYD